MKRTLSVAISFGVVVCFAASALGQAGAATERVHIPGTPDGTSIYPKSMDRGNNFVSIGCVAKSPDGEFLITDYRGGERPPVAGAPSFAARAPLVFRLQGDQEMLNFQVGHEVQITGPIVERAEAPAGNVRWTRFCTSPESAGKGGTTTAEHAKPKP